MSNETDETTKSTWSLDLLKCSAGTDVGLRREENQDSFGIIKRENFHAYLVADGMGGVQGGGVASRLAISSIEESLSKIDEVSENILVKAVNNANAAIHQRGVGDQTLSGMGTTLVGLVFTATKTFVVNIGDSRAYLFQKFGPKQLSEDHTLVGELIRSGAITKEQAANHPVSHMLTRSLGPVTEVQVDCKELGEVPVDGDVYLLCSDGLYGLVSEREILAVLRESSLDEASQSLIALANDRGGNDNITLILIAVGDHKEGLRAPEPVAAPAEVTPTIEIPPTEPAASMLEVGTTEATSAVIEQKEVSIASSESAEIQPDPQVTTVPQPPPEPEQASQAAEPVRERSSEVKSEEPKSDSREPLRRSQKMKVVERPAVRVVGLVVSALVLGLIVGRLFGGVSEWPDEGSTTTLATLQPTSITSNPPESQDTIAVPTSTEVVAANTIAAIGEPTIETGRIDLSEDPVSADERGDELDIGRLLKTRELFESALAKTESQLSSLDQPITGELGATLSSVSRRHANLNNRRARIEEERDAASRKLVQWYNRQKRLETQDPLKLAGEVGATSDEVQKKNLALQKATHEYIRKRDELELYPSNEALREEVLRLRDDRGKAVRELQDIVKVKVHEILEDTHKSIDELNFEYNTVNWEIQSTKQELDVVKARMGGDSVGREQMRQTLTGKRDGLRAHIAELTLLINSKASNVVNKSP